MPMLWSQLPATQATTRKILSLVTSPVSIEAFSDRLSSGLTQSLKIKMKYLRDLTSGRRRT